MSIDVFPATVLNATLWNGQTYEEGTFTLTATGFTTVVTATATYRRIGKMVTVAFANIGPATSNAGGLTLTGMPPALYAGLATIVPIWVIDNSVHRVGTLAAQVGATWYVYLDANGTPFTASGVKGLYSPIVQYVLP
jgi:hypothetical protein